MSNYLRLLQMRRGMFTADAGAEGVGAGEGGAGGGGGIAVSEPGADGGKPEKEKDGAPVDFGALLKEPVFQSEFDKRVDKALATAREKWEKDAQTRIKAAKSEGEKLAKLSAEERAKMEAEQRVADVLAREEQMNAREAEIMRRELRAEALITLEQRGLPVGLADVLSYVDAETCSASIEAVEKVFRQAVQTGVDARLKPKEPPKGGGGTDVDVSAIFGNKKT